MAILSSVKTVRRVESLGFEGRAQIGPALEREDERGVGIRKPIQLARRCQGRLANRRCWRIRLVLELVSKRGHVLETGEIQAVSLHDAGKDESCQDQSKFVCPVDYAEV